MIGWLRRLLAGKHEPVTTPGFIWLDAGPYPIAVGFTCSNEALRAEGNKIVQSTDYLKFAPPLGCAKTWCIDAADNGGRFLIIELNPNPNHSWAFVCSTVAHEAVHVAQYLWDKIGEEKPGWEAEAYFVDSIVYQALCCMGMPERRKR